MFRDRTLTCRDCHDSFTFTIGEQEFFASRGLSNDPKRCPNCRLLSRLKRNGKDTENVSEATCAECGAGTKVPFRPRGHAPIYCTHCYALRRNLGAEVQTVAEAVT